MKTRVYEKVVQKHHNEITISVVVPLYNKISTIERTIDSILLQRRPADEIIVVDDCSTDGSGDLVAAKYPDLQLIRKSNGGVSSARNKGISVATGNYVAFLDSDDWWSENVLAAFYKLINRFAHAAMYTVSHYRFDSGRFIQKKIGISEDSIMNGDKFIGLYSTNSGLINSSSVCVKKKILQDLDGFPECYNTGEDTYLWLSIALLHFVAVSPLRLVYVDRATNLFGSSKGRNAVPGYINHFCNYKILKKYPQHHRKILLKFIRVRGLQRMLDLVAQGDRSGALRLGLYVLRVNWIFLPCTFAVPLLPRKIIKAAYKHVNKSESTVDITSHSVTHSGGQ
jgi:glycosyltransferase involved in cell wall biosynthesis